MQQVAQRLAQQTRNPKVLNAAIAKMSEMDKFCTCKPYLEGEEVFGFQKCKVDMHFGYEYNSHMHDKVNISYLQVCTRSTKTRGGSCSLNNIPQELSLDLQEDETRPDVPIELAISIDMCKMPHILAIQETACDDLQYYIAKLPKTSLKACFAQ